MQAIEAAVRPGDIVVDLGSGPGFCPDRVVRAPAGYMRSIWTKLFSSDGASPQQTDSAIVSSFCKAIPGKSSCRSEQT